MPKKKRSAERKRASAWAEAEGTFKALAGHIAAGDEHQFVHILTKTKRAILAREEVDVNLPCTTEKSGKFMTAFYVACDEGHLECVELLSQAPGIQMDKPTTSGLTPFAAAVARAQKAVVKFLLRNIPDGIIDYNHNCTSASSLHPFFQALDGGHKGVSKLLLADKRISKHHNELKCNAMDMACIAGSPTLIRLLSERGFEAPIDPQYYFEQGLHVKAKGLMTDRRALAEDMIFEDCYKLCGYCQGSFQRKSLGRCSRCLKVWYCSRACQRADWKREDGHKQYCFSPTQQSKGDLDW